MQKAMRLLALFALLALPTTQPVQAGCYSDCYAIEYFERCSYLAPDSPEAQQCGRWAMEICRCNCFGYCP